MHCYDEESLERRDNCICPVVFISADSCSGSVQLYGCHTDWRDPWIFSEKLCDIIYDA